jgi:SAM-dependent methyltransferase
MDVPPAKHLPGGNRFDDVRLDLPASFPAQDEWLGQVERRPARGIDPVNRFRFVRDRGLAFAGWLEPIAGSGLMRWWFDEFYDYWKNVVGGRPLTTFDFHQLLFHYRRGFQQLEELDWESPEGHVAHWLAPKNLYLTFHFVRKYAFLPIRHSALPKLLRPGARALEYGCAVAPVYRTWRRYLAHVPVSWVLADIPGFPFHYARHAYGRDAAVERFVTISPDRFDDPLAGVDGRFDLIVIQEVFEHLDHPHFVAGYLLERLEPGGILLFDYLKSEGQGLDTGAGLAERDETIRLLSERLEIVHGDPAAGAIGLKR